MVSHKGELNGIQVHITEESYTSKARFPDGDLPPAYDPRGPSPLFSGRRIKCGLYQAAVGRHSNADANSAYNSMGKVAPQAFAHGE